MEKGDVKGDQERVRVRKGDAKGEKGERVMVGKKG